jgi:excisionase family DNA binding protein
MNDSSHDIITASISEFCRVSGLGRSKTYEMLADGQLKSVRIGKRRLIVLDSYRRMIDELASTA